MPNPNHGQQSRTHERGQEREAINVADIRFGESISDELYAGIAENKAKLLSENSGRETNKSTQLRRFYDELSLWNEKVNATGTPEERQVRYRELAPLIKMMNAKVVYARGRKHVDENFERLFRHCIGQVSNPRTLEQCKLFMEAFMGFYKAYKG